MKLIEKLHKIIGIILALPFIVWALTGLLLIPQTHSLQNQYQIKVKQYPIIKKFTIVPHAFWQSYTVIRSVLGYHLIVKTDTGYVHLDPVTFENKNKPNAEFLKALINDALSPKRKDYGTVVKTDGNSFVTTTGLKLKLNWNKLEITIENKPHTFRNTLLQIHRFEWTGDEQIDRALLFAGGLLAFFEGVLTLWLLFKRKKKA